MGKTIVDQVPSVPFIVRIWPVLNIVLLIAIVIAGVIFIRVIYKKIKKIDKLEKNTDEIIDLIKKQK